jgi:MFS family permease
LTEPRRGSARALVPLYVASAILTLGEGSFTLLTPPYMHGRGVDEIVIGAIVAVYGIASLLTRIPAGALYRSHRAGLLIFGGCCLCAASFALIPLTGNPALLAALVGLDGVGFAVATTGAMAALIERRPPGRNAGSIMGWYTGSVGAGYALAGVVAGPLGDEVGLGRAIVTLAVVPLVAGLALALVVRRTDHLTPEAVPSEPRHWLSGFRHAPPLVWLAFFVTLYINLISGVILTFFPIYGLELGLTMSELGLLFAIHGAAAAAVRFGSGLLFRWVSYERVLPATVVASGLAVAALAGVEVLAVLAIAWGLIGLTRGVLRVASAALVMDAAGARDSEKGAASGIYLAGLDLGKIVGPIVGGVSIGAIGFRGTFVVISVVFPLVYLALAASVLRRPAPAAG